MFVLGSARLDLIMLDLVATYHKKSSKTFWTLRLRTKLTKLIRQLVMGKRRLCSDYLTAQVLK